MLPTVCGEKFYPGAPSLEETIKKISGTNYWEDKQEGLDTRETIDKIRRTRVWGQDTAKEVQSSGRITGKICNCGAIMTTDGSCWKCPKCKRSEGCGGG